MRRIPGAVLCHPHHLSDAVARIALLCYARPAQNKAICVRLLARSARPSGRRESAIGSWRAGTAVTPQSSVAVQLAAQEAKAWARIGDLRQTEVVLDRGRRLLDSMPYPENLDHHFVVDPTKFDFYAMDCYRMLADDKMAENLASEVIQPAPNSTAGNAHPCAWPKLGLPLGVDRGQAGACRDPDAGHPPHGPGGQGAGSRCSGNP